MARRPSSLALYPDATGVSEIERSSTGTLLLGNAGNAAAALSNSLIGLDVAAVICVASSKNASILRAQCARTTSETKQVRAQCAHNARTMRALNLETELVRAQCAHYVRIARALRA